MTTARNTWEINRFSPFKSSDSERILPKIFQKVKNVIVIFILKVGRMNPLRISDTSDCYILYLKLQKEFYVVIYIRDKFESTCRIYHTKKNLVLFITALTDTVVVSFANTALERM